MKIVKDGNKFVVNGKSKFETIISSISLLSRSYLLKNVFQYFSEGPYQEDYSFELIPDNTTRTDIDLGALGGPRKATAEFVGNVLMTYLHKPDTDEIDVVAVREIKPENPNVMIYTLKDLPYGYDMVQHMDKQ